MSGGDKRALEDFRVRQHAGPHPAVLATTAAAPGAAGGTIGSGGWAGGGERIEPDTGRAILHFDVDSFYAQVEEVRDPSLRGRPLGVTQKYLVVTCNYEARQQGVTKLMGLAEARKRCPQLVLVSGEDLTPYRAASKQILAVLQRYGTVEKGGFDEAFVDVTTEAQRRLAALPPGAPLPPWRGHLHSSSTQLQQDSKHRPMDLRAVSGAGQGGEAGAAGRAAGQAAGAAAAAGVQQQQTVSGAAAEPGLPIGENWEPLLRMASVVAAEARAAVRAEAGYRTSAGIACNKTLAKLVSGLHKPDDQTVLPPPEAAAFVAPLPVRALPGVGHKLEKDLEAMGVATAGDLRGQSRQQLLQRFGERVGAFLHAACRGKDPSPVVEKAAPKSVSVEDSFKSCSSFAAAEKVVAVLAPDLLARLQEEQEEGRRPSTLSVKWRHRGSAWQRSSASCPMPPAALASRTPQDQQVAALASASMALLRRNLTEPFDLSLINLGATGFSESSGPPAGMRDIAAMLGAAAGRAAGKAAGAGAAAGTAAAGQAAGGAAGRGAGVPSGPHPAVQQQQQQQQQQRSPPPGGGRLAAEASAQQRRSYSDAPQEGLLLSKRLERQLREHHGLPAGGEGLDSFGQQNGMVLPPKGSAAAVGSGRLEAAGWGEAEEEDDGSEMWSDLQTLAGGGGGGRRSPTAAGSMLGNGIGGLSGFAQQQQQGGAARAAAGAPQVAAGGRVPGGAAGGEAGRVIIHADVDSFYCQVERLDDPSLLGVPLAVSQFNAGGFVAVSYEARAAGIRCGDGAGAAGRAAVPHLVAMQAASLDECRRRCPRLVVKPMRTDRYRQVAQQVHQLLRGFAPDGQAEKTSYDDFYLDVTAACRQQPGIGSTTQSLGAPASCSQPGSTAVGPGGDRRQQQQGQEQAAGAGVEARPAGQQVQQGQAGQEGPPPGLLVLTGAPADAGPQQQQPHQQQGQQQQQQQGGMLEPQLLQHWRSLPLDLRRGVLLAAALRQAAKDRLGLTLSCGVARNKLVARMASPLSKPDGLAVVPDGEEGAFMRRMPLHKVPSLRGKFGEAVASQLGATSVADLAAFGRAELVRRFGEQRGGFLAALPLAQDDTPVRERGPQQSIAAERSFPPLPSEQAAGRELAPLARTLLARAAQDGREHRRLPSKLVVSYRQGYGSNPRSKSGPVPAEALSWLRRDAGAAGGAAGAAGAALTNEQQRPGQQQQPQQQEGEGETAAPASALVSAALGMLRPAVAASGWQLTRLALSFAYDASSSPGGSGQAGAAPGLVPGQRGISAFVQRGASSRASLEAGGQAAALRPPSPASEAAAAATEQQPERRLDQHQRQQQQPSRQQQQPGQQQQKPAQQPAPPRPAATYRNAEALALRQMFAGGSGGSSREGAAAGADLAADLAPGERASLELALRLQAEEARAAAAGAEAGAAGPAGTGTAPRKRSAPGTSAGASGRGRKQQRQGSGPLDAFLRRGG